METIITHLTRDLRVFVAYPLPRQPWYIVTDLHTLGLCLRHLAIATRPPFLLL